MKTSWRSHRRNRRGMPMDRIAYLAEPLEGRFLLATDFHVDVNSPGPMRDGTSWVNAYTDLQQALAVAVTGDRILVADGTYTPTATADRKISFQLKTGVSVFGGYAGHGAANPDARDVKVYQTILSGNIGEINNRHDNSYHVVRASSVYSTVLDGVTITGGEANDLNYEDSSYGAGMYISYSSPTLTNCTFSGNSADFNGGGIWIGSYSSPNLTNCAFSANAADQGGGMYNRGMYNETSSTSLTNCTFNDNSAGDGAGMYTSYSSPILTNCVFSRNSAIGDGWISSAGGGIYNDEGSPILTNCRFSGNSATNYGGAFYSDFLSSSRLTNCAFSGNWAGERGGGMYISESDSPPRLTNCTFSGNSACEAGGVYSILSQSYSNPVLINCILWGNQASAGSQISLGATVSFSDIEGGFAGAGNLNTDPLFLRDPSPGPDGEWGTVDDDYGDLRLFAVSSAVDAGNNAAVPTGTGIATDLSGNSRFQDIPTTPDTGFGSGPIVDLGAYETSPSLTADTGGPYVVFQGQERTLDGRGASTVAGALQYTWEWTGDGLFNDATGASPVFSAVGLPAPSTFTISLRVTDAFGQSIVGESTLKVIRPVVYVDARAVGSNDGSSWANAMTNLALALQQAVPAEQIRVAGGTWKPTNAANRTISFQLSSGVAVCGGYAGVGDANPDARDVALYPTILSGDIGVAGDNSDNSYHVVTSDGVNSTSILDGFTITAGNANGAWGSPNSRGGGMLNLASSPTLTNCTFSGNSGGDGGGGGMCNDNSSPTLANCTFRGNLAAMNGGAMYNTRSSPTLVNCIFSGNWADGHGGGIYNDNSSPTLANCTLSGNLNTRADSGGIYNYSSSPTLANCILWRNPAPSAYPPDSQIAQWGGHTTVSYSDVQGGSPGTGNINADPLFVQNPSPGADGYWGSADDQYGDLRLQDTSPCIDAASNAAVPSNIKTDVYGSPRVVDFPGVRDPGCMVDMGAYEHPSDVNRPPTDIALSTQSVREEQPIGTVIGMLTASDPDGDSTFAYTLVSGEGDSDNASFTVSGNQLITAVTMDRATQSSYSLRVKATDTGGLSFEKAFTVAVIDDVNHPPTLDPLDNQFRNTDNLWPWGVYLSGISAGAGDEGQALTITATCNNYAVIWCLTVSYVSGSSTGALSITTSGAVGTAVVTVTVRDSGGTENGGVDTTTRTFSFSVVDRTPPDAPSVPDLSSDSDSGFSSSDNVTNVTTPIFRGTVEPASLVKIYCDGTIVGSGKADATGVYKITVSKLNSSSHKITASATDAAGNTSVKSGSLTINIKTAAPAMPSGPNLAAPSGSWLYNGLLMIPITGSTTPTFTGTAEPGGLVVLYSDGVVVGSATALSTRVYSIATNVLRPGDHSMTANVTDAAGNCSVLSASKIITVDTAAPTAVVTAKKVTKAKKGAHSFTVVYSDFGPVDLNSIGSGDIQVTGPRKYRQNAKLVSKTRLVGGKSVKAVYSIVPPGGGWDRLDGGTYTVSLLGKQVRDAVGLYAALRKIGTFSVAIGKSRPAASAISRPGEPILGSRRVDTGLFAARKQIVESSVWA